MIEQLISVMCTTLFFILRVSTGSAFPTPLSELEEKELVNECINGNTEARNKLIEHNLRLVAHIVKKYYSASTDQDDLLSIGTIGLIKAIDTYKPEKGTKLATYTARCIENEILMHFRSIKKKASEISLSEPIETDKDGNALELMDIISGEDHSIEAIDTQDMYYHLYKALGKLDERERTIIAMRYGLLECRKQQTQREIAKKTGISRSYVSRIEKKALEKLRKEIEHI